MFVKAIDGVKFSNASSMEVYYTYNKILCSCKKMAVNYSFSVLFIINIKKIMAVMTHEAVLCTYTAVTAVTTVIYIVIC